MEEQRIALTGVLQSYDIFPLSLRLENEFTRQQLVERGECSRVLVTSTDTNMIL